jgi:hypothetical protein
VKLILGSRRPWAAYPERPADILGLVVLAVQLAKLYQRYATRCLSEARLTSDSNLRAFLIEMAQAWQRLADQAKVTGGAHTSSSEQDRGD